MIARRCLVSGRVQGVFYRASARERALALGVSGHAINLPDGRVEVLACGTQPAVDELCRWLWQGPPAAHVTDIRVDELEAASLATWPTGFRTR